MKRLMCLCLLFCLGISGCGMVGEWIKEPVTFYYVHANYQKDMEQVIVSEVREAAGHREDLSYLLALYSMGPSKDSYMSLLPRYTQIIPAERTSDAIVLKLSENALPMTDADFTLASTCLALTCMEIANVQQITVECGDKTVTIRADQLLLDDAHVPNAQEEST